MLQTQKVAVAAAIRANHEIIDLSLDSDSEEHGSCLFNAPVGSKVIELLDSDSEEHGSCLSDAPVGSKVIELLDSDSDTNLGLINYTCNQEKNTRETSKAKRQRRISHFQNVPADPQLEQEADTHLGNLFMEELKVIREAYGALDGADCQSLVATVATYDFHSKK